MSEPVQLELAPRPIPEPSADDVAWLEGLLLRRRDWIKAREILAGRQDMDDRVLRSIANQSPNIITGNRGYRHIATGTQEEALHCANRIRSQAVGMFKRQATIRRRAEQIFKAV